MGENKEENAINNEDHNLELSLTLSPLNSPNNKRKAASFDSGGSSIDTSSHSGHRRHAHLPVKQRVLSEEETHPICSNQNLLQRELSVNSSQCATIIPQPTETQCKEKDPSPSTSRSPSPKDAKVIQLGKPPKPKRQMSQQSVLLPQMPCVSTTGNGPNGKTVTGFLYKYSKTEVKIICVCHGTSFSPSGFVEHAGGVDVQHPLKHIRVVPCALA